jgi:hypothetical protein
VIFETITVEAAFKIPRIYSAGIDFDHSVIELKMGELR